MCLHEVRLAFVVLRRAVIRIRIQLTPSFDSRYDEHEYDDSFLTHLPRIVKAEMLLRTDHASWL